jgi:F0F1-type ATP synthase epsilon subunit
MIPKSLALDISTPDKPIVHDEVDEVQLPGYNGALGVLPGHAPLLALLTPGELSYRKAQARETEAEMGKATSLEEADRARLALLTALMKMRAAERVRGRR